MVLLFLALVGCGPSVGPEGYVYAQCTELWRVACECEDPSLVGIGGDDALDTVCGYTDADLAEMCGDTSALQCDTESEMYNADGCAYYNEHFAAQDTPDALCRVRALGRTCDPDAAARQCAE